MAKLLCKKTFIYKDILYEEGVYYEHWENFGGLNHFISTDPYAGPNTNIYPFDGHPNKSRPYIYDYFYTEVEDKRDNNINKILDEMSQSSPPEGTI